MLSNDQNLELSLHNKLHLINLLMTEKHVGKSNRLLWIYIFINVLYTRKMLIRFLNYSYTCIYTGMQKHTFFDHCFALTHQLELFVFPVAARVPEVITNF